MTIDGIEYVRVAYGHPQKGDEYLDASGTVKRQGNIPLIGIRLILKRAPVRHIIGGIVFEETGEVRHTEPDEWSVSLTGVVSYGRPKTFSEHKILRPVALASPEDLTTAA